MLLEDKLFPFKVAVAAAAHAGSAFAAAPLPLAQQSQPSLSSPSVVNFASRVLAVDQESTSFVPIVGLSKAADMHVLDSLLHVRRSCPKLRDAIDENDMEVNAESKLPRCSASHTSGCCRPWPAARCCTSGTCLRPTPTA